MKHFTYLVLGAFLSFAFAVSLHAQATRSGSPTFSSTYTDLVAGCRSSGGKEGGHVSTFCKGPGDFRVHYFDSATSIQVNVESLDGSVSIPLATQALDYAKRGRKLEWRLADGKPFAVIMRVFRYGETGEFPFQGTPVGESLVVKGLPGFQDINFDVDARRPKANEETRTLADTSRTIKTDPNNAIAYNQRGSAFGLMGKMAEAVRDFDRAIDLKPDFAEAIFNRGRILFIMNDIDGALAAYDQAIKIRPDSAEMYFFRAGIYSKKNGLDAAIADYSKTIALGGFEAARTHYYRGAAYSMRKNYDLAVADHTRSMSLVSKIGDKWSDEWLVSVNYEGRAGAYCAQGKKELAAADEDAFIRLTGTPMVRCGETAIIGKAELDKLCNGIDNSYRCAQAVERNQLKRISNSLRAKREGTLLKIKLENGEWLTIEDFEKAGEADSVIKYSFRSHLAEIGYYLIHRQFYEGDGYLLVAAKTGRKYELQAEPVVSSDRQRLVTASNGIGGGYNPNAVQIWRLTDDGIALEQTIEPKDWGPSDAFWETNDRIRLIKNLPVTGEIEAKKEHVILKLGVRWEIES